MKNFLQIAFNGEKKAISSLDDYDKSCGFICGIEELENTEAMPVAYKQEIREKTSYGCSRQ